MCRKISGSCSHFGSNNFANIFFVIILPKKLYLKVDHGWVVEPFFEFDVQEIHEANLANEYFVLVNLFFCVDLSLVKRSDGPN